MSYEDVAIVKRREAYEIVLADLRNRRNACQLAIDALTALQDYLVDTGWTSITELCVVDGKVEELDPRRETK